MTALALPFGSGGLPALLIFFFGVTLSQLPYDCSLDSGLWRIYRRYMKNGHMPFRLGRGVRSVHPRTNSVGLWMANQVENLSTNAVAVVMFSLDIINVPHLLRGVKRFWGTISPLC